MKVERCGLRWTVQDEAFDIWNAYEIDDWCTEQFGLGTIYYDHVFEKPGYRWYNIRVGEICMIKIKHEDDVTLFRLRWGHL